MAKLNPTGNLPYKFIPSTQGVKTEQLKKQRLTRRVSQTMGRKRNRKEEGIQGARRKGKKKFFCWL